MATGDPTCSRCGVLDGHTLDCLLSASTAPRADPTIDKGTPGDRGWRKEKPFRWVRSDTTKTESIHRDGVDLWTVSIPTAGDPLLQAPVFSSAPEAMRYCDLLWPLGFFATGG